MAKALEHMLQKKLKNLQQQCLGHLTSKQARSRGTREAKASDVLLEVRHGLYVVSYVLLEVSVYIFVSSKSLEVRCYIYLVSSVAESDCFVCLVPSVSLKVRCCHYEAFLLPLLDVPENSMS